MRRVVDGEWKPQPSVAPDAESAPRTSGFVHRRTVMTFKNTYEDDAYASAYAKLEFPGSYYLAFRDLPELLSRHVEGRRALDFGCGTGRSTRFLAKLGFDAVGVDISEEMVRRARAFDSSGDYRLVADGETFRFDDEAFDLVLAAFTFDNIPTKEKKVALFSKLAGVLRTNGRIVSLVSAPEIYWNEWASFTTKNFPENRQAKCGDQVRIIVTALEDKRPAVDIIWPDTNYREVYQESGLEVVEIHKPLGRTDEPHEWVSETTIAPWVIYVLGKP
ncbi:MAG: methyltransferase domain-containing protein [bacterium]|nr:methyltransferase domain-containing protein [bacterium]